MQLISSLWALHTIENLQERNLAFQCSFYWLKKYLL